MIFWYVKPSQKSQLNGNKKRKDFNSNNAIGLNDLTKAEEKLAKLKSMLDRGVISNEEYRELRKKTLGI